MYRYQIRWKRRGVPTEDDFLNSPYPIHIGERVQHDDGTTFTVQDVEHFAWNGETGRTPSLLVAKEGHA